MKRLATDVCDVLRFSFLLLVCCFVIIYSFSGTQLNVERKHAIYLEDAHGNTKVVQAGEVACRDAVSAAVTEFMHTKAPARVTCFSPDGIPVASFDGLR